MFQIVGVRQQQHRSRSLVSMGNQKLNGCLLGFETSHHLNSIINVQVKLGAYKRALKEADKGSGDRPRMKGRLGKQGEQLRNWLGEFFVAKYEQIVEVERADKTESTPR